MCETRQQIRTTARPGPPRGQYRRYSGPRRDIRPPRENEDDGYEKVERRKRRDA